MIYLLIISICFVAIVFDYKSRHKILIVIVIVSLTLSLLFFIIYLIQNSYYFNILNQYFHISRTLWMKISMVSIDMENLIRYINLFALLFIYSSLLFCISFLNTLKGKRKKAIYLLLGISPLFQLFLYDPQVYLYIYNRVYPELLDVYTLLAIQECVHIATQGLNFLYLMAGIAILVYKLCTSPKILFIRGRVLLLTFVYASMVLYYALIMMWAPAFLVKVQKLAKSVQYRNVMLGSNPFLYQIFPYFITVSTIIIIAALYFYLKFEKKMSSREFTIVQTFNMSTNMTRVFCHYIKNEVLSIWADTDYIKTVAEEQGEAENAEKNRRKEEIIKTSEGIEGRCRNIYERLDYINQSMNHITIKMEYQNLGETVQSIICRHKAELTDINVKTDFADYHLQALIDKKYFTEAIENILLNAMEELKESPQQEKIISVSVTTNNQWVVLCISDNGRGMTKEVINRIFTPFYSTKPVKKNWGLGLAVSYNIIRAHKGNIVVESREEKGSTFQVLLPRIM